MEEPGPVADLSVTRPHASEEEDPYLMGRRAKAPQSAPARNHALLGWGLFLSVMLGFCAPMLGMSATASIALAGTCLTVFTLIWFLSAIPTGTRTRTKD